MIIQFNLQNNLLAFPFPTLLFPTKKTAILFYAVLSLEVQSN